MRSPGLGHHGQAGVRYAWIGTAILLLLCSNGCSRRDHHRAERAEASHTRAAPERAMSQQALEQKYPNIHTGDVCTRDSGCDAPLRCMGGACRFPPAMTGAIQEAASRLKIHTRDGAQIYYVEIAKTPQQRQRGLMFRRVMQPGFGMLFLFPKPKMQAFWMKNTWIPLDMIFIRADGTIDSIIKNAEPRTRSARKSKGLAQYVLELNGGEADRAHIRPGDAVTFLLDDGQKP